MVQGLEAQDNREAGRTAVHQGDGKPRELTLHEALTEILGAYQHSQDPMGHILAKVQKNRRLQEGQYQGIRDDLEAINTTLVSIAGVLADMANSMREAVSHQRALTLARHLNSPPLPLLLVARRPRHRTNRPPAPLPLQKVSVHQKKGIWHAIAKGVWTLGGLWQAEHLLSETVGGTETLGMENRRGPAWDGLPTGKGCLSNPDPP
ncbi:hypothetical protein NDU88_000102 [Pleurodeles waltl]|uniref:Uncharacterized protein n=1 Tax=Pleurodeles waltl TaxID=8319 RepID=A0AAV7MH67_PLEWA|nr:hypothetical protein NDU88_000102 [Pleurodeles waltl]